jgi:phage antirepressor YoqD-like protein
MNELVVKEVSFNGDSLLAVQSNENGKIYVGVSWVCNGIGLDKNSKDRQVKNIQSDIVLNKGCVKFDAGVFDKNNTTLALEINYLPLWLAKISITPSMIEESNEQKEENGEDFVTIVDKLINYQLKAKDVLAKAFINETEIEKQLSDYLNLDEDERAIQYFKERKERKIIEQEKKLLAEKNEILQPKADSFDIFIDARNNQKMNDVAKSLGVGRNKLFDFLRGKKVLMYDNVPYQRFCDSGYFVVKEHTIKMGNYVKNTAQTFVTSKGVDYIRKFLAEVDYQL